MQFPNARILIFAKEPVVGRVKTRLIPALGAEGACQFHADCLEHTVSTRNAEQIAPVDLVVTPADQHRMCQKLADKYAMTLYTQCGHDLGERMAQAAEQALRSADYVLLTGTDSPALTKVAIEYALQQMVAGNDAVMIPAEDGGYVLLGLRRFIAELFTDMPWGTEQVAEITRKRCEEQGVTLVECPLLWDVDRPEDLVRLIEFDSRWSQHLPRL